ncbi:MAG: LysR family transcriptional regulator [Deltaproteobacteria bacterium]|nr:LysR family transcriptional regulator [Deltaproteobacteria bacterium]
MRIDLNLNQLRAFYLAAKCGSISLAAENLFISQPAVSMQIKAMEEQYRVRLLIRKKRGLELTETGEKVYKIADKIFGLVAQADGFLKGNSEASKVILKIGSTKTLVRCLMSRYISKFREAYPTVQIQIDEGSSEEMIRSVLTDRNDLAIVGRLRYDEKLKVIPFIHDEIILLTAPGHKFCSQPVVSIQDLRDENLILREKGSGTRRLVEEIFEAGGFAPSVFIETGNVDFIKELVEMGKGIAMLARMGVEPDLHEGRLVAIPLLEGPFILGIDVIVNGRRNLSKADIAFLEFLLPAKPQLRQGSDLGNPYTNEAAPGGSVGASFK